MYFQLEDLSQSISYPVNSIQSLQQLLRPSFLLQTHFHYREQGEVLKELRLAVFQPPVQNMRQSHALQNESPLLVGYKPSEYHSRDRLQDHSL